MGPNGPNWNQIGTSFTRCLLVNLAKLGLGGFFDTFCYWTEDSEESGPEMEISGRDLDFGRGVDGRSLEICLKK